MFLHSTQISGAAPYLDKADF